MIQTRTETESAAIDTRYGRLSIPGGDDVVSQFLVRCGEWGWDEVGFVASTLPERARVLDIGAYLGTFGLGLSARKQLGFLCLVEANPSVLPLLRANIQTNAACPTAVVSAMVGGAHLPSHPGQGDPSDLGSASAGSGAQGGFAAGLSQPALTLSQLGAQYGRFDLIKLDVEGMERGVLDANRDYLSRGETTLWLECDQTDKSLRAAELALSWRLPSWYFAFPSHNPDNFRAEREPAYPWAYQAGLLVAPMIPPTMDAELCAHNCILRPIGGGADLKEAMWFTPRWLPRELAHAGVVQMAAAAGRALLNQSRDDFLSERSTGGFLLHIGRSEGEEIAADQNDPLTRERRRREVVEAGFAAAEGTAFERNFWLTQERRRREVVEADLVQAEKLAFERLAQLNDERRRREAAEARRAQAEDLAAKAALDESAKLAAHLDRLTDERRRREVAEHLLASANAHVLARLAELGAERERADAAERKLEDAYAQIAAARERNSAQLPASRPDRPHKTAGSFLHRLAGRLGW